MSRNSVSGHVQQVLPGYQNLDIKEQMQSTLIRLLCLRLFCLLTCCSQKTANGKLNSIPTSRYTRKPHYWYRKTQKWTISNFRLLKVGDFHMFAIRLTVWCMSQLFRLSIFVLLGGRRGGRRCLSMFPLISIFLIIFCKTHERIPMQSHAIAIACNTRHIQKTKSVQ